MSVSDVEQRAESTLGRDRRRRYRARVHWPIQFHGRGGLDLSATETQDLSSDGFFFFSSTAFCLGDLLECTILVPAHGPEAPGSTLPLRCKARIVRVDAADSQGAYGVACCIEDYRFPPAEPAAARAGRPD